MTKGQIQYFHKLVLKFSGIAPWYLSNIKAIRWVNETLHMNIDEKTDPADLSPEQSFQIISQLETMR